MFAFIESILERTSLLHLNTLLLLGLALFGGTVGGRLFQKLRIPQVVGHIIIGIIIGQSGLRIVDESIIEALRPFNYFALGLIGFMIGGELTKEAFSKYGKQLVYILLLEGIAPFILVTLSIGILGSLFLGATPFVWALALLLGAIASATDPATTRSVLKEYKSRGPLTTTILGIVAMDDGLALILFALASSVAGVLIGNGEGSALMVFLRPLYEIGGAVVIGVVSGLVLSWTITKYSEKERILVFSVGTVLLVAGLSLAANVSMLLAVMTLGIIVTNRVPQKSKEAFSLVEEFTPPIYVLFFVLVGAKLKLTSLTVPVMSLVVIYLISGMSGKMIGSRIGSAISRAPRSVSNYLPFSLFSQAGVAIGLSIMAAQHFPETIGNMLVLIIAATTFATQLIGPPFTKLAIIKSGEAGLDITEEDIARRSKIKDFMDKNPPIILENMRLADILRIFSENDSLFYPVVDKSRILKGIITVEGIRQTFLELDTGGLILANDLMEPVPATTSSDASVSEILEILRGYDLDYLPVVKKDGQLEGFIERKKLKKFIATKIIELQEKACSVCS